MLYKKRLQDRLDSESIGDNMNYGISVINAKIRGKGRPRFARGRTYTPKETHDYEKLVAENYKGLKYEGAVSVDIKAVYPIPKSYTKKRAQSILEGNEEPVKKPDIDNIAKIILDGLNGVAYDDDTQVVDLKVRKLYSPDVEKVVVTVRGIG